MGLQLQATTPMDPRVLDAMLPYMTEQYGNPHSRTHAYGWEAEAAVDNARKVSLLNLSYKYQLILMTHPKTLITSKSQTWSEQTQKTSYSLLVPPNPTT